MFSFFEDEKKSKKVKLREEANLIEDDDDTQDSVKEDGVCNVYGYHITRKMIKLKVSVFNC